MRPSLMFVEEAETIELAATAALVGVTEAPAGMRLVVPITAAVTLLT